MAMLFALRFDFRNPVFAGTSMDSRYAAALDMAEWADQLGCVSIALSEHHGSGDGYLPSPVALVAAMAARTVTVRLTIAALIAPFNDPLRAAEDLLVLDNLSRGRVDVIVGGGYVPQEFDMFEVSLHERSRRVTEMVNTLKGAFSGEPFEFRGRTVRVTPPPFQTGGPRVIMGGSSEHAARRAARIGDGFVPSEPWLWDHYRDEMLKLDRPDPGAWLTGDTTTVALAQDTEKGWDRLGPFFLHENNSYGAWQAETRLATGYRTVPHVDALRETGRYRVLTPEDLVAELRTAPLPFAVFHPMCGGIPPELAWESLRMFENEVLPAFR
jgi:alkanesulfonate monooxygenase SsuD/methylene tetrahydromethanopterin reductase-like flavin-dependent oxidoreductase (luciferase family)